MDGPWQHDRGIRLVRNDTYTAGTKANLDAVEITIVPSGEGGGVTAEYNGFQNGQFDWARMPTPVLNQAKSTYEPQGKWLNKKTNGNNYLLVSVTTKPLNSADARKAVSMAIDRNAIVQGVLQNSTSPADALIPPNFPDAYTPVSAPRAPTTRTRRSGSRSRPVSPRHRGEAAVQHRRRSRGVDRGGQAAARAEPRAEGHLHRCTVP